MRCARVGAPRAPSRRRRTGGALRTAPTSAWRRWPTAPAAGRRLRAAGGWTSRRCREGGWRAPMVRASCDVDRRAGRCRTARGGAVVGSGNRDADLACARSRARRRRPGLPASLGRLGDVAGGCSERGRRRAGAGARGGVVPRRHDVRRLDRRQHGPSCDSPTPGLGESCAAARGWIRSGRA